MNVSIVHATLCVQLRILPQEHTVVDNILFLVHPQQLDNKLHFCGRNLKLSMVAVQATWACKHF